jgi:hypothetical protein
LDHSGSQIAPAEIRDRRRGQIDPRMRSKHRTPSAQDGALCPAAMLAMQSGGDALG